MKFTRLNEASQMLEAFQAPGDELFVTLSFRHRFGDAYVLSHNEQVVLPFDSFVSLVADRLAIHEAASKPKPTKRKVAA